MVKHHDQKQLRGEKGLLMLTVPERRDPSWLGSQDNSQGRHGDGNGKLAGHISSIHRKHGREQEVEPGCEISKPISSDILLLARLHFLKVP